MIKKFKGKVIITKNIEDMRLLLEKQEIDLYYDSPFGVIYLADEIRSYIYNKNP